MLIYFYHHGFNIIINTINLIFLTVSVFLHCMHHDEHTYCVLNMGY
ncbi:TIGR00366 family protein [Snodgrassella sp. M0118]|nr:TIGR00366 family protein [Snodgrassella sp. M0110]MBI0076176.1 TIGR00366 family protein [Snodgrassella sp. M0118]MBI0078206.1 TIGR00366 family protein [Snodgrassella sp. M0112]